MHYHQMTQYQIQENEKEIFYQRTKDILYQIQIKNMYLLNDKG